MKTRTEARRTTAALPALTADERRTLRTSLPVLRAASPDAAAIVSRLVRSSAARRPESNDYASVSEVATVFGVSEQTVRNWVDRGVLPGTRTFGTGPRRIPRAVLATAESFQRTASLPVPNFTPADIEDLLARSPRRRA